VVDVKQVNPKIHAPASCEWKLIQLNHQFERGRPSGSTEIDMSGDGSFYSSFLCSSFSNSTAKE